MTIPQALILGIVQGLTEFLPVSSSAHLVLVPWLLNWQIDPDARFVFDVLVQEGTLAAVVIYFWKDLWAIAREVVLGIIRRRPFGTPKARLGWLVVLATLPAVILGMAFKDFFESVFSNPVATAALLLLTAGLLVGGELLRRAQSVRRSSSADSPESARTVGWLDALVIGLAQALSILPGVSRSGSTISAGLARGLERPAAARFSFLMSVPVLIGAGVVAARDLLHVPNPAAYVAPIGVAFVAAGVVGYLCIRWLLGYLARRSLYGFAIYCAVVSVICLGVAFIR